MTIKLDRVIAVRNNKTIFRDGKRCVKIFAPDYSKTRVFSEALNQVKVEECVEFIPSLLEVIQHERNLALVYDFIKGKSFLSQIEDHPEDLAEFAKKFVALQLKFHQISNTSLEKMKDVFTRSILESSLDPSLKYALHKGLEQMRFSSALCHADFVPSNVILSEDGKEYVIDWAVAMSGEPLADAAITYLRLKMKDLDAFAEAYLEEYLKMTNKNHSELQQWIPFSAAFLNSSANEAQRSALLPYIKLIENKGETK